MIKEIELSKVFWNNAYKGAKAEILSEDDFAVKDEMKPIFNKFLNQCDTVLDYGFGSGDLLFRAAHSGKVSKCYGIENGYNIVSYVNDLIKYNNYNDKITIFDGGIDALNNFKSDSIDGVILSNVLDVVTFEDVDSIIKSLLKILKTNGLVMLKLNQYLSDEENKKRGMDNFSDNLYSKNGVMRLRSCTTDEWRKYLSQYFTEEMYSDVPYQADDFYDRLFLLRKK